MIESIINYSFLFHPFWWYVVAFLGLLLEANVVLFTIGFLTEQGLFLVEYILPVSFVATVIGNLIFYFIGLRGVKKFTFLGRFMNFISKPFDEHLRVRPFATIMLSKFIYGINCASLIRAGQIKMPFKTFLIIDVVTSIVWIALVGSFGYSFGAVMNASRVRYIEIGFLVAFIIFFILKHLLSKYAKKELDSDI